MKILTLIMALGFSFTTLAEDIRHLHNDTARNDRAEAYKNIMGKDYTTNTTKTEEIIERVMMDPVVIDSRHFSQLPLPEKVRFFSSKKVPFESIINVMAKTYRFKAIFNGVPEEALSQEVAINNKHNSLEDVLNYLEYETKTNIVVWPKGSGSTIMITGAK